MGRVKFRDRAKYPIPRDEIISATGKVIEHESILQGITVIPALGSCLRIYLHFSGPMIFQEVLKCCDCLSPFFIRCQPRDTEQYARVEVGRTGNCVGGMI
jgi:hypothetical protein